MGPTLLLVSTGRTVCRYAGESGGTVLTVSVVVPVLNAVRTLPYCLAALERLTPQPLEIILVDNGSTDGTAAMLRDFAREHPDRVHIVEQPRRGISRARNAGIGAVKGELIAWTDADCAPMPAWLQYLTAPFSDPTVGAVAGRVMAAPDGSLVELFCGLYTFQTSDHPELRRDWTPWAGGYAGANFAVRLSLVQQLGGYDEDIEYGGEDYDLCARLYKENVTIAYTPAAHVYHHHRTTLRGMMRQAFGQGRSHPYLLRRHAARGLWLDIPMHRSAWKRCPVPMWLSLASADKKVLAIFLIGAIHTSGFALLPLYGLWLAMTTSRRAQQAGTSVSFRTAIGLAGLLLLKSSALTAGRWWGSVKYGALCL